MYAPKIYNAAKQIFNLLIIFLNNIYLKGHMFNLKDVWVTFLISYIYELVGCKLYLLLFYNFVRGLGRICFIVLWFISFF